MQHTQKVDLLKGLSMRRYDSSPFTLYLCLDCLFSEMRREHKGLRLKKQLFLLVPVLIKGLADQSRSIGKTALTDGSMLGDNIRFVSPTIISDLIQLTAYDVEMANCGHSFEKNSLWWRGATGKDLDLYTDYLVDWLRQPEGFNESNWGQSAIIPLGIRFARAARQRYQSRLVKVARKDGAE